MAIVKLDPVTLPDPVAGDWAKLVDMLEKAYKNFYYPLLVDYDNDIVPAGVTIVYKNTIYYATSNTAITGTPSKYVRLTYSSDELTAAYVSNLSGVTWNVTYNAYYDSSDNLYIFNELDALNDNLITDKHTVFGYMYNNLYDQSLRADSNVVFNALEVTEQALIDNIVQNGIEVGAQTLLPSYTAKIVDTTSMVPYGRYKNPFKGTYRIHLTLTQSAGATMYAQVYVNGVATGALHTFVGDGSTKTFDTDVTLTGGETIEIRARVTNTTPYNRIQAMAFLGAIRYSETLLGSLIYDFIVMENP